MPTLHKTGKVGSVEEEGKFTTGTGLARQDEEDIITEPCFNCCYRPSAVFSDAEGNTLV